MGVMLLVLASYPHPESDAAAADLATLPQGVSVAYVTLSSVPEGSRGDLLKVISFVAPSLSSKPRLAGQLPVPITDTLVRLDLDELGWATTYPQVIAQHYVPSYRPDLVGTRAVPLVVDGLWFAANLMDSTETGDAQYLLLYGGKAPKTVDEFLSVWGIQADAEYVFGIIEGQSGVAVQRTRLIENRPGAKRNYGWLTRDSRSVAGDADPLEKLPNKARFDAQEVIVGNPKWIGGRSGVLQAYFLANGQGQRQEKAPPDIVVDHVGLRGVEIRNTISCVSCHATGLNEPTTDQFKLYVESGARVGFADRDEQRVVDQYLSSDVAKEVVANKQAYADGVKLCNGMTPEENAAAFITIVKLHDADVTIEQAARELHCSPRDLQLALASYSVKQTLTGRLALLAQGRAISRNQFRVSYRQALEVVKLWREH